MTENVKLGPVEALTRAALAELPETELERIGAGKRPPQEQPAPPPDHLGTATRTSAR